jgi:hypothetical protein
MPRATLADLPVPAPEPDDLGATRRPARNHGRKIFGDMQSDARAALAGHSPGVTDIRTSDTRYLARLAGPTSTPGNPPPGCRPRSAPWGLESPGGHKSAVVDTTAVQACTATPRRPPRAAHRPENSRRKTPWPGNPAAPARTGGRGTQAVNFRFSAGDQAVETEGSGWLATFGASGVAVPAGCLRAHPPVAWTRMLNRDQPRNMFGADGWTALSG